MNTCQICPSVGPASPADGPIYLTAPLDETAVGTTEIPRRLKDRLKIGSERQRAAVFTTDCASLSFKVLRNAITSRISPSDQTGMPPL
jgi:hypothetical protein